MHDKIIARRHNSYRLRAGTVTDVDQGKGPLLQAGLGPAKMEKVTMEWDGGDVGEIVRRFPIEIQTGQRLYALTVESGVSVHPERPVFVFNAANGHQHREVNAPSVRSTGRLFADRLPIVLAAVVVGAFMSIYATYSGSVYGELVTGLGIVLVGLLVAWGGLMAYDVRQNGRRAERLEDEQAAALEAVEALNLDIRDRIAVRQAERAEQEEARS
jgi:hypothetical protein